MLSDPIHKYTVEDIKLRSMMVEAKLAGGILAESATYRVDRWPIQALFWLEWAAKCLPENL